MQYDIPSFLFNGEMMYQNGYIWVELVNILLEYKTSLNRLIKYDINPYNPNKLSGLGNICVTTVLKKGEIISEAYLSLSTREKSILLEKQDRILNRFIYSFLDSNNISIDIGKSRKLSIPQQIDASYIPNDELYRIADSERIALNILIWQKNKLKSDYDELYLLTERVPCNHCIRAIFDFANTNPNVTLNIGFFFSTKNSTGSNKGLKDFNTLQDAIKASKLDSRIKITQLKLEKEILHINAQVFYFDSKGIRFANYKKVDDIMEKEPLFKPGSKKSHKFNILKLSSKQTLLP